MSRDIKLLFTLNTFTILLPPSSLFQIPVLLRLRIQSLAVLASVAEIPMDESQIYEKVQEAYSAAVKCNNSEYGRKVAAAFGYSEQELAGTPDRANLGLSCGNPLALAKLREVHTSLTLPRRGFSLAKLRDVRLDPLFNSRAGRDRCRSR